MRNVVRSWLLRLPICGLLTVVVAGPGAARAEPAGKATSAAPAAKPANPFEGAPSWVLDGDSWLKKAPPGELLGATAAGAGLGHEDSYLASRRRSLLNGLAQIATSRATVRLKMESWEDPANKNPISTSLQSCDDLVAARVAQGWDSPARDWHATLLATVPKGGPVPASVSGEGQGELSALVDGLWLIALARKGAEVHSASTSFQRTGPSAETFAPAKDDASFTSIAERATLDHRLGGPGALIRIRGASDSNRFSESGLTSTGTELEAMHEVIELTSEGAGDAPMVRLVNGTAEFPAGVTETVAISKIREALRLAGFKVGNLERFKDRQGADLVRVGLSAPAPR